MHQQVIFFGLQTGEAPEPGNGG